MKKCINYLLIGLLTVLFTDIYAQRVEETDENTTIIVKFDNELVSQDEITEITHRYEEEFHIKELDHFQTCDHRLTFCLWQVPTDIIIRVIGNVRDQPGGNSCRNIPINLNLGSGISETQNSDNPYPYLSEELRHIVYEDCSVERGRTPCVVNIMDTGLDDGGQKLPNGSPLFGSHINLEQNYIQPNKKPIDDMWHGTHVAGIVATLLARQNTDVVDVNISRALNQYGKGSLYDVIHALADNMCNTNVFNFSFSYKSPEQEDMFTDLMRYAGKNHGCLFVVGSGNDSRIFGQRGSYILPAESEMENMIAVYALNNKGDLAANSNFGKQNQTLRIGAPGEKVYSTVLNGQWAVASGTSMAAPSIAAAAAILATYQNGRFDYHNILNIIEKSKNSVGTVPATGDETEALNVCAAIRLAQEQQYDIQYQQTESVQRISQNINASPNPSNGLIKVSFEAQETGMALVQLFDLRGQELKTKQIDIQKGQNTKPLDLQSLPSGIYQLFILSGKERKAIKIYKN